MKNKLRKKLRASVRASLLMMIFVLSFSVFAAAQKKIAAKISPAKTITVITEPQTAIWIDDILRGKTDETGKLIIRNLTSAPHKLRVRAPGFKEFSQNLTVAQKGELKITLTKTEDEAELALQQAEVERNKQKAVELYRKAIELRPKYAEAYLAIARLLTEDDPEEALKAIAEARKARPAYAEASAVEGRIYNSEGNEIKAVASYKRAIAEGKGFQPEAHAGLGLIYRDKAEGASAGGDYESEKQNFALAANELSIAVKQLSGAPDAEILMQILGGIYEKMREYKKAIAVYEDFLRVFPDSGERSAVESFIVQLKKEMNGEQ